MLVYPSLQASPLIYGLHCPLSCFSKLKSLVNVLIQDLSVHSLTFNIKIAVSCNQTISLTIICFLFSFRKFVRVRVVDDEEYEKNETFFIWLDEPYLVKKPTGRLWDLCHCPHGRHSFCYLFLSCWLQSHDSIFRFLIYSQKQEISNRTTNPNLHFFFFSTDLTLLNLMVEGK